MKIAYLALAAKRHDNHAGFTHPYHISRVLSGFADVTLFISGPAPNVLRGERPRIVELTLPSSVSTSLDPIDYMRSAKLAMNEMAGAELVHERFRYNPLDLIFAVNRKYVLELNDLAGYNSGGTWGSMRREVFLQKLSRCDAVVTQTQTLREHIRELTDRPVFVVPNGVDTEMFSPSQTDHVRDRYGIGEDEILVTYVGSFRPWHGISIIAEAAGRVSELRRRVRFMLIGNGPLSRYARNVARKAKNLIITGDIPMEKVPGFISSSDICIAPFSSEFYRPIRELGFWWCPVKLFEYMSCGKPIVSVDFPEVKKIVRDTALLSPPGDHSGFSRNIVRLIDDDELREELGNEARRLALSEHSWNQRSELLLSIYDSL